MSDLFTHGYALLIGVGTTENARWSLPVTTKDAQALKAILTDPNLCAYPNNLDHVQLLQDQGATRSAILNGLDWLKQKVATDQDATVVLYYSGHGMFDLASHAYYLLQHDFDRQSIPETALAAETLTQKLREINAKRLWVIIDSCHAEGMASAKDDLPADFMPTALPKGVVDALKQGEGRAVFTSSRGNQSSWVRPDGTLSLYTYHLIEALKGAANQPGDRQVTLSNIMTHLGKTVAQSARVASLAVLGDERLTWRPRDFGYEIFGCRVQFQFPIVKLLDYADQWQFLEESQNPFATVVMAHLKTQATRDNGEERKNWKLFLIKRLYEKG